MAQMMGGGFAGIVKVSAAAYVAAISYMNHATAEKSIEKYQKFMLKGMHTDVLYTPSFIMSPCQQCREGRTPRTGERSGP